jgi:ribonuclease HI
MAPMTEPRRPRKAWWRELPPAEMAAHLLATPTIADGVWTSEPRLPRETRSDFVRRVLLGGTPESMVERRKPHKASWRELPPSEMAAHLLATPTIVDGVWTSEPRLPGETRSDFVRRVLLGDTPEPRPETLDIEPETLDIEPETREADGTWPAGVKRGYYLLNTDGGNRGDRLGRAAIGALLRTRRLVTVAQISKEIGPATHNVAEYRGLIEGLKLARECGIQQIRVYMDSEIVVDQVNGASAVRQAHLSELHSEVKRLVEQFRSFRISWVPRELNVEADRLVNEALGAPA